MRTAIAMPVLAFLSFGAQRAAAGDSNSLSRVPKDRSVTVHLKNGRSLKGTLLEVGDRSLQLIPTQSRTRVRIADLTRSLDRTQVGHPVEVSTRNGQVLRGTLHEVGEEFLWVDEARNAIQVDRAEVRRVTRRSHGMGALIGLAAAGGGGAVYGARTPGHTATWNQGAGDAAAEAGGIFGLIGALVGGIIGIERTIYNSASPN